MLTLKAVFHLTNRQTEGFVRSVFAMRYIRKHGRKQWEEDLYKWINLPPARTDSAFSSIYAPKPIQSDTSKAAYIMCTGINLELRLWSK